MLYGEAFTGHRICFAAADLRTLAAPEADAPLFQDEALPMGARQRLPLTGPPFHFETKPWPGAGIIGQRALILQTEQTGAGLGKLIFMFHFSIQRTVAQKDVNYRKHVSYDRYLVFFHEARIAYLKALGYDFDSDAATIGMIAAEARCNYKKEIGFGDVITVKCSIREIRQKSAVMEFLIVDGDRICAEGSVTFLYFDYRNRRVTAFPDRFVSDVRTFEEMGR